MVYTRATKNDEYTSSRGDRLCNAPLPWYPKNLFSENYYFNIVLIIKLNTFYHLN